MSADNEWHEFRRQGIGGSDIGALLGLSRYASPWSLWADKVGLIPPSETTERQQIGHDAEAFLAGIFTRRTGLHVAGEQTWCVHPTRSYARCTVDGFVVESAASSIADALGTVQFKTDARRSWRNIPDPINGVPAAIEAQCQWEMGVTETPRCWLVVGFAGWEIEIFELTARPDDFAFMVEQAAKFWGDHVLTGTPPAVDGSEATTQALAEVWPEHRVGLSADLDELIELTVRRADLKDDLRRLDSELDEIDNLIKAAMGEAEIGTIGGTAAFTLRTQDGRKSVCSECGHTTQGKPYRVLRPVTRKAA